MSTIIQRSFKILEQLSSYPEGRTLTELAAEMDVPLSATHRLLSDLVECGYVDKDPRHGDFRLTMQVVSLGLRFLSASGISDIAQPALDRLAAQCGELVRLAIVDKDRLIFVAKAQGASQGLRYDPEMGQPVTLSCSAAGFAWLATMDDEEAMRLVVKQGFGAPGDYGPQAPTNLKALMAHVRATRKRGFSLTVDVFQPAMNSMATVIRGKDRQVVALLIVAGPMARLTEDRMMALGPDLLSTAEHLSRSSAVSPMLQASGRPRTGATKNPS
jgi:IclR family acetate operon transcriptional repressor